MDRFLWTAKDASSQTLITNFYVHLAEGEVRDAALRHANMDLIGEFGDQALPFYWAGFVIVGGFRKYQPLISVRSALIICIKKTNWTGVTPLTSPDYS